ncbi:amidase [Glutamicibacter endophyticus]
MATPFNLIEAGIDEITQALETGATTSVELVSAYLARIGRYDRSGIRFNAVPVLNPELFAEAAAADERRVAGTARELEGVPFTVKDSYMARGLTVASGSPAFKDLESQFDAFSVGQLRQAGGVLVGKTNMPPMADGGMQRGVYGRAESPYNTNFLPAAFASGSSNGSGVSTAANMSAFGMGEETVSSGRSPASNNSLCAYTPSRGVISIRGNWPLFPTRDVVVPHTRTMADMLRVLDVLVAEDEITTGDFWRDQKAVELPPLSEVRPASYRALGDGQALQGKRFGAPKMYLGKDANFPIEVRPSVLTLWEQAKAKLEELGAEVIEVDLPVVEKYEGATPGGESLAALGTLPEGWMDREFNELLAYGWDAFLRANNDPKLNRLADVDHLQIFPAPAGSLPDRYEEVEDYENRYRDMVALAGQGRAIASELPGFSEALHALEAMRKEYFEDWLAELELDGIVFPANADVAPADADVNPESADKAWANGVFFSNGNYVLRHFGIPSITVPMGIMEDIDMPVGLTIAGAAYDDSNLLAYGYAFDAAARLRGVPALAPELPTDTLPLHERSAQGPVPEIAIEELRVHEPAYNEGARLVTVIGTVTQADGAQVQLTINGEQTATTRDGDRWEASAIIGPEILPAEIASNPVISQVLAVAHVVNASGRAAGAFAEA